MLWTDLKTYVNASSVDDAYVQQCWNEALELVTHFVGTSTIPQVVKDRATLACGSELFHARQAPNGIVAGFEVSPVRIARDPMTAAYPLLSAYMVVGL